MDSNSQEKLPSDRRFGLLFAFVFAGLAIRGHFAHWPNMAIIMLAVAAMVFSAASISMPRLLKPLNVLWHKLGLALGRIVSPLVLAVIFFVIFTPISVFMRLFGRDELRLLIDRTKSSYWVERQPAGPEPESFRDQF